MAKGECSKFFQVFFASLPPLRLCVKPFFVSIMVE